MMRKWLTILISVAIATTAIAQTPAPAPSVEGRITALEGRVASVEAAVRPVGPPTTAPATLPATAPATQPATQPAPVILHPPTLPPVPPVQQPGGRTVRADSPAAVRASLSSRPGTIQTSGLTIVDALNVGGATLSDLGGGGNCMTWLKGRAQLANATLVSPKRNAIYIDSGATATVSNVVVADGALQGFDVARGATLSADNLTIVSTREYGGYVEPGATLLLRNAHLSNAKYQGLLRAESAKLVSLDHCVLDNSMGGNAALRGDALQWAISNSAITGKVGLNPLPGNDGGQMMCGDRWVFEGRGEWQLPRSLPSGQPDPRIVAAKTLLAATIHAGKSPSEATRLCFNTLATVSERAALGRPNGLTDRDIALTLAARNHKLRLSSMFRMTGGSLNGQIVLNARVSGVFDHVVFTRGDLFSTDSTNDYPEIGLAFPGEAQPRPTIAFLNCTFAGGHAPDVAKFPGVTIR